MFRALLVASTQTEPVVAALAVAARLQGRALEQLQARSGLYNALGVQNPEEALTSGSVRHADYTDAAVCDRVKYLFSTFGKLGALAILASHAGGPLLQKPCESYLDQLCTLLYKDTPACVKILCVSGGKWYDGL